MRKKLGSVAALVLLIGGLAIATPATAVENTFTDTPPSGPVAVDASSQTRIIPVSGVGTIAKVVITLDFHKIDGGNCAAPALGSAYSDEIGFSLMSPAGTTVKLIDTYPDAPTYPNWSQNVLRTEITLDDAAATAVGTGGYPQTGTFTPVQPLSAFAGEDPNGDWTLNVTDSVGGDSLCYYSASLTISDARASTETAVAVAPNPIVTGSGTVLTATVTGANPTGDVEFFADALSLGTAPLVDGAATLPVSGFEAGSYQITAVYAGDADNLTSATSEPVILTVTPAPITPAAPTPPRSVETAAL